MRDFEKLGVFYLGHPLAADPSEPFLYDSKNLTTHAVCVGMTGSGKTGLGIALLEEAAIDNIPAIIVDPKGDLTNLLLTFPNLSPSDFLPWIDPAEAERKGMQTSAYAESVAKTWKDGLEKWGEDGERIRKMRNAVDLTIYTPASNAGVPLSILSSFAAPPQETLLDTGAMRDRVMSVTSSLLGLLGINADPIKSREHILISTLIDQAWRKGTNLDIATLIQQVQNPPFSKLGALDLDTFFPAKDRTALSINLNSLLASPGFQAWMEGQPLDIQQLLYTKEGKARLAILSIAHLSDTERMFFVTLLLNELLSWMRRQTGTSSLRALFYMDEIFGYFPPTATPPSKLPMLTLLKQARAFGLGIMLATQNPVDLDYKGLANCGTWFIGKLQTERDKARVVEGLVAASNGELDAASLDKMIASTGNRVFLLRSIYQKDPMLFETRWTLSYLRGPLTLTQIATLTDKSAMPAVSAATPVAVGEAAANKPGVPTGIRELFVRRLNSTKPERYGSRLIGTAKLHFVDTKSRIDTWQNVCMISVPNQDSPESAWQNAENIPELKDHLDTTPISGSTFQELPSGYMQAKNYPLFEKALAVSLYQSQTYTLYKSPSPTNMISQPGESEGNFRTRVALAIREKRDELIQKIREKYTSRIATLTDKGRRAQDKLAHQQQQAGIQKANTLISVGTTVLGALFGKGVTKGTIGQAGTSIQRAGRISKENADVQRAEEDLKAIQEELQDLQSKVQDEIAGITSTSDANTIPLESVVVKPKKGDISIEKVALLWYPL